MTRKEAIKQLKGDITESCATFSNQWEKDEEAISVAIASLKTDEAYQLEYENRDFVEIPKGMTNGEVIQAIFGSDNVFGFIHYVHLMAKVGNWFNEGVVAEFDKEWWNAPYKKGGE